MATSVFGTCALVIGAEDYLRERAVNARVEAARRESPDAELTQVSGVDLAERGISDLISGSIFSTRSVVVIDDVAYAPEPQLEAIRSVAASLDPDVCLVLVHPGGNKSKKFFDALRKSGVEVAKADPIKAWKLGDYVAGEATRLGIALKPGAADALVQAVGADLRALSAALRQLGADYEDQPLDETMVKRYFAGRAEVTSFAVADDVLAGRTSAALEKLGWALGSGVAPVLITAALANSLRSLGRYLNYRGMNEYDAARAMGVPVWKMKNVAKLSPGWSPRQVSQAIRDVARADGGVKGGGSDPSYVLERLIIDIAGIRSASRDR